MHNVCLGQAQQAEDCINSLLKQDKVAGLSVAVVKKGKIIYTHSFGLKNIEANTPLTDNDLFRIASISKSFSATAIMQLVKAKKLSLDDDVSKWLGFKVSHPQFPGIAITVRMLLSHRSGITDSQGYFTLDVINPGKNPEWAKCYADYKPGTGYKYCNLNFNLAGAIIEKVSGERFDNYIRQHITNPLGLYGGFCVDSLDNSRFATLYEYDTGSGRFVPSPEAYAPRREQIANYTLGYSTPVFSPAGGMKITAADLARYMTMHVNYGRYKGKRIISKKSAKLMQASIDGNYGYGLALTAHDSLINGKILIGHTGSAYGLSSAMFFEPKEKFGIVAIYSGYYAEEPGGMRRLFTCLYEHLIRKK